MKMWKRALFVIAPLALVGCKAISGLHQFDTPEIINYLRPYGCRGNYVEKYWQDADGRGVFIRTQLDAPPWNSQVFLLRADQAEPRELGDPLEEKSNPWLGYWFEPSGEVRFLPPFALPTGWLNGVLSNIDPQSGYFLQEYEAIRQFVSIGYMKHDSGWLFEVQTTPNFDPGQVCARGNVIYLLDHHDYADPGWAHSNKNCWAFAPDPKDHTKYVKIDEFRVPGLVLSVDPFSPRFMCMGYGLMPFPGHPFVYDIQAHKVVGDVPGNGRISLFLDSDWLDKRIKRQ